MSKYVTLKYPVRVMINQGGLSYVEDPDLNVQCNSGSEAGAMRHLRKHTAEQVRSALRAQTNCQRRAVFCRDRTVLLVEFRHDEWGYTILGPDRTCGSTTIGFKSYLEALDAARRHSEAYGGKVGECS